MNKKTILTLFAFLLVTAPYAQGVKATLKIDIERKTGAIDPLLYGNFTEHLGRCIYGGIYEPASPKADADGFRTDVLEATKNLGVSILRWPGGNFVSGYKWTDGIGPKEDRPKRRDLAWGDVETNQVGTDEFIKYSRKAGAEPYICINLGIGTLDEARNWVEYCNAPTGLYYSDLRAKNGHPEPYNVKYWALGNEIDGPWQMGHKNAEDYSKMALEAAKIMRWSDRNIKLIACGTSNYTRDWPDWNRTVLTTLRDQADYIAMHHYAGDRERDHYKYMASITRVENNINILEGIINEVRTQYRIRKPIYIAFDEYNVWYRAYNDKKLEETYNLQDALFVAQYLNCFVRKANIVKMANMAQLVNVIAPMTVTNDKLWLQTIYYPLQLFASNCKGQSLETFLQSDTYTAGDYTDIPYLDVSAAYNEEAGELIINVVNRHSDKPVETTLMNQTGKLAATAQVMEINSNDLKDENSATEQKVKTSVKQAKVQGNNFTYTFPAHSFTQLKIKVSR